MAYATNGNVQDEFKSIDFTATNAAITTTKVDRWIIEAEAEINGRVGLVYQVPIDSVVSPISFALMRSLSIGIVSTRIKKIIEVKTTDEMIQQGKGPKDDRENARVILEQIVNQTLHLSDALKINTKDGVKNYTSDNLVPLHFQRGVRQW